MRNIPLAIFAAFATFITFSGALVALNHPSNAEGATGQPVLSVGLSSPAQSNLD